MEKDTEKKQNENKELKEGFDLSNIRKHPKTTLAGVLCIFIFSLLLAFNKITGEQFAGLCATVILPLLLYGNNNSNNGQNGVKAGLFIGLLLILGGCNKKITVKDCLDKYGQTKIDTVIVKDTIISQKDSIRDTFIENVRKDTFIKIIENKRVKIDYRRVFDTVTIQATCKPETIQIEKKIISKVSNIQNGIYERLFYYLLVAFLITILILYIVTRK